MKRNAVAVLVNQKAARFGDQNPQELEYLTSRLAKIDAQELRLGLVQVFTEGAPAPKGSAAQERAGALLANLRPAGDLDLNSVIRDALPRYELSVEQFPQFLAGCCGKDEVLQVLASLVREGLRSAEQRAAETMTFWLQGKQANSAAANEA